MLDQLRLELGNQPFKLTFMCQVCGIPTTHYFHKRLHMFVSAWQYECIECDKIVEIGLPHEEPAF